MANIQEPSEAARHDWNAWVAGRPPAVRAVAARFEPWKLYRLRSTGHRVTLVSFAEQPGGVVTLKVQVNARYNFVAFERNVFGVDPEDLEECDLPAEADPVGSVLSQDDVEAMSPDQLRAALAGVQLTTQAIDE